MASRDATVLKLGWTCERAVMTAVQTYARWKLYGVCSSNLVKIKRKGIYSYVKFDVVLAGAPEREMERKYEKNLYIIDCVNLPSSKHLIWCRYTRKGMVVENDCDAGGF
jgi:hypothetical protein